MSFFRFKDEDIIQTNVLAHPTYRVELNGDHVTGSVFLEKPFLDDSLLERRFEGISLAEGGLVQKDGPFTASVDIVDAEQGATNRQLYQSILNLYRHYSLLNDDYTSLFTGSETTRFRVITVPEIYYDREILTGSFSASDLDNAGNERKLYDNGRGGIYSGSLSGTIVGNIFYSEGLIVLKGGGLNDESNSNDFGENSPTNFKWRCNFQGVHKIPTTIFRCRAPAGQLNASSNPTFYHVPQDINDVHQGEREIVLLQESEPGVYVTAVGLYNEDYELVGVARLAQPVKKTEAQDLLFRIRLDF